MNDIVFQYDVEARARVTRLERTELTLMSIVLFVLMMEALFVFAPAARVIRRQFTRLWESKECLSTTLNSIGDAVIATDAARLPPGLPRGRLSRGDRLRQSQSQGVV